METRFPHLFQPGRIGSMEVNNRIFMAPMATGFCESDGSLLPAPDRLVRDAGSRRRGRHRNGGVRGREDGLQTAELPFELPGVRPGVFPATIHRASTRDTCSGARRAQMAGAPRNVRAV